MKWLWAICAVAIMVVASAASADDDFDWKTTFDAKLRAVERKVADHDSRFEAIDAHIESIHSDISGIYDLLKPTTAAPTRIEKCENCQANGNCIGCECAECKCKTLGTAKPKYVVHVPSFVCPACERLKASLSARGIEYDVVVSPNRSMWPGLTIDGKEVSASPLYLSTMPNVSPSTSSFSIPATSFVSPVFARDSRAEVPQKRGLAGLGQRLFGRRRQSAGSKSGAGGGECGCLSGGYSCGASGCHRYGKNDCACR